MPDTFALVTGASSGLGSELASELARLHGRNVILTGRSEQRLRPIKERIAAENPAVTTVIITSDLSEIHGAHRLFEQIDEQGLVVDELVNNAGASANGSALDLDPKIVIGEMLLDYVSAATLTMLFLARVRQHGLASGRIIQILSMAARFNGMPNFAHYNSAKKALDAYSKGVEFEIRRAGLPIQVHRVYPGAIVGTKIATSSLAEQNRSISLTAAQVARVVIAESRRGKRMIIPGFINKIAYALAPHLPQFVTDRTFFKTYEKHESARNAM